jgi:signal transduction histidine kinase
MENNRRILVVDDDQGIRDAFSGIFGRDPGENLIQAGKALFEETPRVSPSLKETSYDLTLAASGEQGLLAVEEAVASGRPFAVVFLDMRMPGMDGAETARRIWQKDPRLKVVIVTAYSEFTTDEISDIAGRADLFYLKKPFAREEIRQFARSLVCQWDLETERDRLQRKLTEANTCLESTVAERTQELRRANERLEELDQDKMTFLRYLSHEMNTPLNWISAAGIIDCQALSEEDQEMMGFVGKGFERLRILVQEVLSYFEMAGQELALNREAVEIRSMVLDVLQMQNHEIETAGLTVDVRMAPDLTINADPGYLRELLETLIRNAVDYSLSGGTVTISGKQDGNGFSLEIEDQGKGIPPENLKKIFEAFATESFDRRESGCGLNLPRARLIAAAHGWKIWAESRGSGQGARFVVAIQ